MTLRLATSTLSRVVVDVRARLQAVHRGTAPPPVQVVESMLASVEPTVLVALCTLGVPDHLTRPMSVDELVEACGSDDGARIRRLLAFGASRGWLRFDRSGRVRPTAVTRILRRDHPDGWHNWVAFLGSPEVCGALREVGGGNLGPDPFESANGAPLFEWYAGHPEQHVAFDGAMSAMAVLRGRALARAVDWHDDRSVCDVGGGTGGLLGALLEPHAHLTGTVYELPAVVTRCRSQERLAFVPGDARTSIPSGHDTYLFSVVLHDWPDDDAVAMLRNAAEHRPRRVLVVDKDHSRPTTDTNSARVDMLLLAITGGGHERTLQEIRTLGGRAGLVLASTTLLATGETVFELHRRD